MRIALIIAALNAGGAERVMVTLANQLVRKKHTVDLITFNDGQSFYSIDDSVNIISLNLMPNKKNKLFRFFSLPYIEIKRIKAITKLMKKNKYDASISFCFTANLLNIVQYKINCSKTPCIVSERNDPKSYGKLTQFICKNIYAMASYIVCQNDYCVSYYRQTVSKNKLGVIYNPINTEAIAENYSLTKNHDIVAVGRLIPQKRFDLLIDAFSRANLDSGYKLRIFGVGPCYNDLKNQILDLGLQDRVYLEGTVSNVFQKIYQSAMFVMSSDFEGFPNVLLEAMASGIPVISTDFSTGIAKKLIKNNENGFLVPTNNVEALRIAIEKLAQMDKTLITKNNYNIRNFFNIEQITENWLSLIIKLNQ